MSDSRELAEARPVGGAVAHQDGVGGIPVEQRMALLREALVNPDVDPAKAVAMADLMFKLEDRDRKAQFNRDLIAAKAEIGPIFKRGENKHQGTKYAKFEDIQRVTDPILHRHGLSLDYKIGSAGKDITVTPVLRHINGWVEEGDAIPGPPDTGPGRSAIQSIGSAASYLQRYAAKAALNLRFDGEDNDGVRPNDQLNDRQQDLVADAQAQADAGNYMAWFARLSPKDRSVLIGSGAHARLGGATALPGSLPDNANQAVPRQDAGGQQKAKRTPVQIVESYEAKVRECADLDALRGLQTEEVTAKWIAGLRDRDPELHQRVLDANSKRFQELGGDLFPGEE